MCRLRYGSLSLLGVVQASRIDLSVCPQEKLDALSLEYTSLLTSMLDSQRIYYEEQLDQVQEQIKTATSQIKSMMSDVKAIKQENEELSKASAELNKQLADTRREKAKAEKRLESWLTKTRTVEREYQEEKEVSIEAAL